MRGFLIWSAVVALLMLVATAEVFLPDPPHLSTGTVRELWHPISQDSKP
jgi:hypothetical protein